MSKKPSRRKKARAAKRAPKSFIITVEAQPIRVRYEPDAFCDTASFEYRSPHRPPRRIPLSSTGYRRHHVPTWAVKAAKSVQELAHEEALRLLQARLARKDDPRQLPLFS